MTQPTLSPDLDPAAVRALIRGRRWNGNTVGICPGYVQANVVILPEEYAEDFRLFCTLNPRPLPLLDVTSPGDPVPRRVAPRADIRVDLTRYRVFRDGAFDREVRDLSTLWRNDLVAFLLGCSFTTVNVFREAGIRLRNVELHQDEPSYRSSLPCEQSVHFAGSTVVSMRPIARRDVELATVLSAQFPLAHGGPLHIGDPQEIGIRNLAQPDWGIPLPPLEDEVAMYWACGLTAQEAVERARPRVAIMHASGHMLITDILDKDIRHRASFSSVDSET